MFSPTINEENNWKTQTAEKLQKYRKHSLLTNSDILVNISTSIVPNLEFSNVWIFLKIFKHYRIQSCAIFMVNSTFEKSEKSVGSIFRQKLAESWLSFDFLNRLQIQIKSFCYSYHLITVLWVFWTNLNRRYISA